MADLSVTPVASGIKPVAATSLADMLNIARGAQAYQQSQQLNPLALQQAQEELTSKQLANQLAQGTLQPKIVQQENLTAQSEMETDVKKLNKINAHANDVVQNIQDLLRKPDLNAQDIVERAKDINAKNGGDEQSLAKSLVGLPQYGSPADYKAWAAHALARTMASQAQLEKLYPNASLVSEGGTITPRMVGAEALTNVKPGTAVGEQISTTLPVGSRYEPTGRLDTNNNPTAYVKDASGKILGEVTIPAGANPIGAGEAPARLRAGETPETAKIAQDVRTSARDKASEVPMQVFNSNQIIKLADDVISGKGAGAIANLTGGYAAIPWTSDNAANMNQLGHYMALQTASLAKSSGLSGTDAANKLSGEMAGTTEWTAPAIKETARVNRALATGTELFNKGVQNSFEKTKDPFAATDFQNKWISTLGSDGINAIRLYDATKNHDTEAIKAIVKSSGGIDSAGYKSLLGKLKKMNELIKGQ